MAPASAVTVASLPQARGAILAAARLQREVYLLSTPSAAAQAGGGWFAAVLDSLRRELEQPIIGILDCGTQPGWVLESLTLDLQGVVFNEAQAPMGAEVGERLRQLQLSAGRLYFTERPAAISLIEFQDEAAMTAHLCREWQRESESDS